MTELLHKQLTRKIIGVYYDVYNGTSHNYPEHIYERAMMQDLHSNRIHCQRQNEYQVLYKEKLVGVQQLDLLVNRDIVVEIKVAPRLTRLHKAQAISYLKAAGKQVSLLFNFGSPKPEFERLYFQFSEASIEVPPESGNQTDWPESYIAPEISEQVIGGLYQVHSILGPGFIHRIYANAVYHELSLCGLDVFPRNEYQVIYRGQSIGEIKFNHIQIGDELMVFPVAVQNINDLSINNLKDWMAVRKTPLGILANFYPTSLEFIVLSIKPKILPIHALL